MKFRRSLSIHFRKYCSVVFSERPGAVAQPRGQSALPLQRLPQLYIPPSGAARFQHLHGPHVDKWRVFPGGTLPSQGLAAMGLQYPLAAHPPLL